MRCPRCHHENRGEARFCAACGSSLAARCPACGYEPPRGAAFCDHCGTPLTRPPPPISPLVAPRPQTLQAHCHRGLGSLYAKIGQREQARAEVVIAIELYKAMDMTFWLPQAEAALTQVEKP
jgi:Double zinc ribbon